MEIFIAVLLLVIIAILLQINSKIPNWNDPVEAALKRDKLRKEQEEMGGN
ncbi:hypothetical protein [Cohnella sp. 56]